MMPWELPTSLEVNGRKWEIRTDYRDVLRIISAFEDPDLESGGKMYVCLRILYKKFDDMSSEDYQDAYGKAVEFIDNGAGEKKRGPRTMDWEQDAMLLFPAVNKAAGFEVRSVDYLHWYTFLGYFLEIRDSVYATVVGLRQKRAKGKKLEKSEKEFWDSNADICVIKPRLSEEERAEKDRLKSLLG